jgi:hypothetical protein
LLISRATIMATSRATPPHIVDDGGAASRRSQQVSMRDTNTHQRSGGPTIRRIPTDALVTYIGRQGSAHAAQRGNSLPRGPTDDAKFRAQAAPIPHGPQLFVAIRRRRAARCQVPVPGRQNGSGRWAT